MRFQAQRGELFRVLPDPHLKRTLDVYRGIPEYVRNFRADEREMTKYIIGTISGKDVPRTPQMQGSLSRDGVVLRRHGGNGTEGTGRDPSGYSGRHHNLAPLIEAVLEEESVCVVGSETAVQKEKELFGEIKSLITC